MPVTVTSTPALTTSYTNLYSGLKIKPDISFNNNTGSIWSDDNILTVGTNNDTTLAMTTAVSAVQNVPSGSTFRSIDLLDHLDIGGGAGSIYLKHSGLTYGDLIIDNGGQSSGGGYTNLISSTANTNHLDSSPNTTTAQITSGATSLAGMTNLFSNYLLQIFPTNSSGVGLDPANNLPLITLNGNGTNNFTTATGTFPSINANYDYRFVYQLDHLDIGGKAIVNTQGADI